jgi:hypothetical protein
MAWWPGRRESLPDSGGRSRGLDPSHGHKVHPGGFVWAAGLGEIGEFADVVNLQVLSLLADLAALGSWLYGTVRRRLSV